MSNEDSNLRQSMPLASIASSVMSTARNLAVPAGNDHPLATAFSPHVPAPLSAPPPPPTPNPTSFVPNLDQNQHLTAATPGTGPVPPSSQTPPKTPQTPSLGGSALSPASQPIDALADFFLNQPSYRTHSLGLAPILRPLPLPKQEGLERLRTLVERRAWGDVLKISTGMLNSPKGPHGDVYASLVMLPLNAPEIDISNIPVEIRNETVEIMTLQCHAWLKLRRYNDLAAEVERWNFFTHNDVTAQSPDWLPWSLHILAGQVLQFTEGDEGGSISCDILFAIRDRIPADEAIWLTTIDNALANVFLRQSKWRLALGSLDRIQSQLPSATQQYVQRNQFCTNNSENTTSSQQELEECLQVIFQCEILSRQGRIFLQIGALPEAANCFERAAQLWTSCKSNIPQELANHKLTKLIPVQLAVNEGLHDFAQDRYEDALSSLAKASEILRSPAMGPNFLSAKYDAEDWMGPNIAGTDSPVTICSEIENNKSLCALYMCRMSDAVGSLEGVIREDPGSYLTERTAFNLCTLYELGADTTTSIKQKKVLQLIAKRFFLHDIGAESFRIN